MSGVQTSVNVYYPLGIPGDIAFDGPRRAAPYNLVSTPLPNYLGYAYTVTGGAAPDPASASPVAGNAAVGGTGVFAGILTSRHNYQQPGTSAGALVASLAVPDGTIGELMTMGFINVNLPGPANIGDLVTYDPLTGALDSITPTTTFTGSIAAGGAATPDVLTVSALTAGRLGIGSIIAGTGIPVGTTIISLGTGKGYTGTYNISTINQLTVSSEAMTAGNVPDPAWVASSAAIATSVGVDTLTITTLTSGSLNIGSQVFGAGVAPNTVITAFGSGVGGTGTYTLNTSGQTVTGEAMSGPANSFVPRATVYRYTANTTGGNAVIQLTN